jgi:hypothetical protein
LSNILNIVRNYRPGSGKKRLARIFIIAAGLLVMSGLATIASSCTTEPAVITQAVAQSHEINQTAGSNPNSEPAPVSEQQPITVTNNCFQDYNGNGIQDGGEYGIEGIKLTYQPGDISCTTDRNGKGVVTLEKAGSYSISIDDPSSQYKYILSSITEFVEIRNGINVNISKSKEIAIPLGEGFLTWPFARETSVGIIWFFESNDPTADPLAFCTGTT